MNITEEAYLRPLYNQNKSRIHHMKLLMQSYLNIFWFKDWKVSLYVYGAILSEKATQLESLKTYTILFVYKIVS